MPKPEPDGSDLPNDKLESWKEIASYVDRTVSTVKRWERSEGLPVHRHVHKTQGSVYASRTEIDDWRKKRSESPVREPTGPAIPSWRSGTLVLALLLATTLLTWLFAPLGPRARSPDGGSNPRIWLLVADFENDTSENLFDGTISQAMRRSLSFSPRLAVLPQERINDVLRLMKKPLDTTIDPELARGICQRDAGIDAIVAGRVEAATTGFRLEASILDPATGGAVASRSVPVSNREAILTAVEDLGEWARGRFGEEVSPRTPRRRQLEAATTPSLKALQLYSRGMQMGYRFEWGPAKLLFERAIEEDPDFASAQIMLAWAIRYRIPPTERAARSAEFMRPAERALALSPRLPDLERLWIEGSYFFFGRRYPEAAACYEALFGLHPDHYYAAQNLANYYASAASHRRKPTMVARGVRYLKAKADLRPNDFGVNTSVADALACTYSDFDAATVYARRALALAPPLSPETFAKLRLFLPMASVIPALKSFVGGDPKPFSEALQRLESYADPSLKPGLFSYYLALGQIKKAKSFAGFQSNPGSRGYLAVDLAYSLGRGEVFREELKKLQKKKPFPSWFHTAMLARAGLVAEADAEWKLLADRSLSDPAVNDALRGLLALAHGNIQAADGLIDSALSCPLSFGVFLLVAEAEAESLQKRGRAADAAGILERALSHRGDIAGYNYFAWRLEVRLSRLYRKLGRVEEARIVENRLLSRLSLADPDHPAVLAVRDGKPWLEP